MKKLISLLLVIAAAGSAAAQETPDTVRLEPVVVTATRIPQPLGKVTASVIVITGDQLRGRGIRTVDEALRTVSGAAVVQTGSYGASTALFLRGGESDYVQVLIDGVQINSPGEQFNWSNLSIEDIERIEIVKGPASVLYGSDAVTGVVQLITRHQRGKPRGEVSFSAGRGDKVGAHGDGSFDNAAMRAEVAGGSGKLAYSFGASHFGTEGAYAFNNRHRNTSVTGRTTFRADEQTQLSASARYGDSRFHYPTDGTGQLVDQNQFQDASMLALGLDASHRFARRFDAQFSVRHNQNDDATDDDPDNAADTLGFYSFHSEQRFRRQDADVRVNYHIDDRSVLTIGSELEWQSSRGSSASPFGDAPETTEQRHNRAAYAQWLGDFAGLSLQLGVRGEDNDKFGTFATYRGGLSAQLSANIRVRASVGTAFKEPRFFEQFAQGFVKGNPALQPERTRSVEGGVEAKLGRAALSASYFDQRFVDLIQYTAAPATPADPNYMNVAGARAAGLELATKLLWSRFSLDGSYTLLDTRVTDEGDGADPSFLEGEPLLRRPRHSGSLALTANLAHTTVGATASYVGERDDLDFSSYPANRIPLPAYTRIDLAAQRRLTQPVSLSLKIENVLGEDYEEVYNFPARGRVVSLGATVGF